MNTTIEKERADAEQQYTITAFDYVKNPVGSYEWFIYWKSWQACAQLQRERQAQPTLSQSADERDEYIERLEESLKDAIGLRVKLFRGGDFEGDTDKLPDADIINRESYARKWQKALDSRPDDAMKEGK